MSRQFFTCIFGSDVNKWRPSVDKLHERIKLAEQQLVVAEAASAEAEAAEPACSSEAQLASSAVVQVCGDDANADDIHDDKNEEHWQQAVRNSLVLRSSALALSELTRMPGWGSLVDREILDEELPFRVTATFWMNDCTNSHVWQKQKLSALHVSAICLASLKAFRAGAVLLGS